MYQAAAEKWVKKGIAYHSIALYAHEETALSAFFDYGFGRRCADAIRMMEPLGNYTPPVGITFKEEDGKEKEQVNRLHRMLKEHMGKSPCFMGYPVREEEEDTEQLQEEKSGSRFFTAMEGEKVAAYVEVTDRGENFATQAEDMRNICGAYCLPEYRGRNIYQGLLDYMILCLKKEGFLDPKVLQVDTKALMYQVPGGMLSNMLGQLKQAGQEDRYYDVLAEVPRVRKDFGYPPLVTPTSQIVGTQAVMNIVAGERYKMVPKESKGLLRGEYGKLPGKVNEEVRRKCIGDDKVITCRPADLIEPELEKYRAEIGDRAKSEEDVLSYALFPAVATKFFEWRDNPHKDEAPAAEAAPAAKPAAPANNGPKTLYVEDLTNGNF